jgi:hypothetical protein
MKLVKEMKRNGVRHFIVSEAKDGDLFNYHIIKEGLFLGDRALFTDRLRPCGKKKDSEVSHDFRKTATL